MKVRCIDKSAPRSDFKPGPPTALTVGLIYTVAEVLNETGQYSIINDDMKMARYSKSRFEVIGSDEVVPPLREAFNTLTTPMRTRIKQLEKELAEALERNRVE